MSESANSHSPVLGLLVIRSNDMDRAARFYQALGISLVKHSHPPCGEHYATTAAGCVFEIYQARTPQRATTDLTFGFHVPCVDEAVRALAAAGGAVKRVPEDQAWGKSATIVDLDGNNVILMERRAYTAAEVAATFKADRPAPSDQTVDQWIDEHRMTKYGR